MVRSLAKRVAVAFAFAGIAAVAFVPVTSAAQSSADSPTEVHYTTAITTAYGSPYPIAGHLDLQIFPNGILRGYYHNAYVKQFIPVTGGKDGNYIWFDIGPVTTDLGLGFPLGPMGKLHVIGTMGGEGGFRGQLYPLYGAADSGLAMTGNVPAAGPGNSLTPNVPEPQPTVNNQFLFAAKPTDKSDQDYPFTAPASPSP